MRKRILALALVFCALLSTTVTAQASYRETAVEQNTTIEIDGKAVRFQMYALLDEMGYPTNYIKLRDLADVLNGTKAQFNVTWDGVVNIADGAAYIPYGGEHQSPFTGNQPCRVNAAQTKVDGVLTQLDTITITDADGGDHTYYKLRDLGAALGFYVDWDSERSLIRVLTECALVKLDGSYYNYTGDLHIVNTYEYVRLNGDSAAAAAINADQLRVAESHLEDGSGMEDFEWPYDGEFTNEGSSTVTHLDDRVCSISVSGFWFMGGVANAITGGRVYSMTTGEVMDIADVFPGVPDLEQRIKTTVKNHILRDPEGNGYYDDALELVDGYVLEDFSFIIDNGELVLIFGEYELTYGYGMPFEVHTGLFIN